MNFSVVVELVNDKDKVIGRQTYQTQRFWEFNERDEWYNPFRISRNTPQILYALEVEGKKMAPFIYASTDDRRTISFPNISVNDITDNLSIRFVSINGNDPETAAQNGILQIRTVTKSDVERFDLYDFRAGEISGFISVSKAEERHRELIIPDTIWGEPVTIISEGAFHDSRRIWSITSLIIPRHVTVIEFGAFSNNELRSLTIPFGVTSIGARAFEGNMLANITIPPSVTSIGSGAFRGNMLTDIVIPSSVKSIGDEAFSRRPEYKGAKLKITIGADVSLEENSFDHNFSQSYNRKKRAGVYSYRLHLVNLMDSWKYSKF